MSQALQGKTESFINDPKAPDLFWNGIPLELGALAIDSLNPGESFAQGLPITQAGRIAVDIDGVVDHFGAGATPFTAAGALAVVDGGGDGIALSTLAGNGYTSSGQLILGAYTTLATLLGEAVARFDETSIVGSNPVTAWNNVNGDADFNLDTVVGTAANLTRIVGPNGLDVVDSAGDVGMKTAVAQLLTQPTTVFLVVKSAVAVPLAQYHLFDMNGSNRTYNRIAQTTGLFLAFAGSQVTVLDSESTAPHVLTSVFNGVSGSFEVSGFPKVDASIGTNTWDFATLFSNNPVTASAIVWVGEWLVFNRLLTDNQITAMQDYLSSKWL